MRYCTCTMWKACSISNSNPISTISLADQAITLHAPQRVATNIAPALKQFDVWPSKIEIARTPRTRLERQSLSPHTFPLRHLADVILPKKTNLQVGKCLKEWFLPGNVTLQHWLTSGCPSVRSDTECFYVCFSYPNAYRMQFSFGSEVYQFLAKFELHFL